MIGYAVATETFHNVSSSAQNDACVIAGRVKCFADRFFLLFEEYAAMQMCVGAQDQKL